MEYFNNQYINIEGKNINEILDKCRKIKVKYNNGNKNIEDLEIKDNDNVLICVKGMYYYKCEIDYNNIYSKIKIIITDGLALENKWREIPEYIEYIIVDGIIHKNNKNKLDFIRFIENKKDYLRELIIEKNINFVNSNNETLLYWCCVEEINEIKDLIKDMSDDIINKICKNDNALIWACYNNMIDVIIEILKKNINEENMNLMDKNGYSAIYWICYKNIKLPEETFNKILKLSSIVINKTTLRHETVLMWACYNNMTNETLKIIEIMDKKVIKYMDDRGYTAFYYAYKYNNKEIMNKILKKIDITTDPNYKTYILK